jgi:hypothetical protein
MVPAYDRKGKEITGAEIDFDRNGMNDLVSARRMLPLDGGGRLKISIVEPTNRTVLRDKVALRPFLGADVPITTPPVKVVVGDFKGKKVAEGGYLDFEVTFADGTSRVLSLGYLFQEPRRRNTRVTLGTWE